MYSCFTTTLLYLHDPVLLTLAVGHSTNSVNAVRTAKGIPTILRTAGAGTNLQFPRQKPTVEVSDKPSRRLPLLSVRPTITSQIQSITALGRYQFILLGKQRHMYVNDLPRIAV